MRLLYSIFIHFYHIAILIVAPFNVKAKQWIKGRKSVSFPTLAKGEKLIWIHAASLGEFEQGRPIIESIKRNHSEYKILLTFFSPSGYEVRKNYQGADYIYYLPLDTSYNAKLFLKTFQPEMAIFIKYEYWYNYLNQLKSMAIPYYFVSAIYRPNQIFFKNYGSWFVKHLAGAKHIFCQDEKSKMLLDSIDIQEVTITGDTRFDRVLEVTSNPKKIKEVETFSRQGRIIIAGSSWEAEEDILEEYMRSAPADIKLIIAPHLIDTVHIDKISTLFKTYNPVLLTDLQEGKVSPNYRVLIINAIGFLMHLYQYGHIALIGGGFGKGIHNILEASTFGLPVLFGPNFSKFNEAKALIKNGGAFSIANTEEFKKRIDFLFESDEKYEAIAQISKNFVVNNGGATKLIVNELFG